jgi:hypothetical protein
MTSPGKADKICRVLETFKTDKRQLKQALQTVINLHRDYSIKNIASLRDIIDGFGLYIDDNLLVTSEKKVPNDEEKIEELFKKYHDAVFDADSGSPLPFKRCPQCGSTELKGSTAQIQDDIIYTLECKKCGWSEFTEI